MPLVLIHTNAIVPDEEKERLAEHVSSSVAAVTGKSEEWAMVSIGDGKTMSLARDTAPTAFVEVRSIGLAKDQISALISAMTDAAGSHLGVPPERVYVEVSAPAATHFGWNGEPFA